MRRPRWRRWFAAAGAVTWAAWSIAFASPGIAAGDPLPPGLAASTDSVKVPFGKTATVTIVNLAANDQTLTAVLDGTLSAALTAIPDCGQACLALPTGEPRVFTLSAIDGPASAISGTVLIVGSNPSKTSTTAASSVSVKVTLAAAPLPASAVAQPSTVTARTDDEKVCVHVTLAAADGFEGAHGALDGPHRQGSFALVAESKIGTADTATVGAPSLAPSSGASASAAVTEVIKDVCSDANSASKLLSGPPAGHDPNDRYVLVADDMADAGKYTAPVALDSADPKTTVTVTVQRTYEARTAWWWCVLGTVVAVVSGFIASLVRRAKSSFEGAQAFLDAVTTQQQVTQTFVDKQSALGVQFDEIQQTWLVVGNDDDKPINSKLSNAALGKLRDTFAAEADAARKLVSGLADTETPVGSALGSAVIAMLVQGPELDADKGKGRTASTWTSAEPWYTALRRIAETMRTNPSKMTELAALREKAVAVSADASKPGQLSAKGAKGMAEQIASDAVKLSTPAPALNNVLEMLLGNGLGVTWAARRITDTSHALVPSALRQRFLAKLLASAQARATLRRNLFYLVEAVAAVVAAAVGLAVAMSTQYYANDTWGGAGDYLKAATWAVTASGAVQVSKLLFVGGPAISLKAPE